MPKIKKEKVKRPPQKKPVKKYRNSSSTVAEVKEPVPLWLNCENKIICGDSLTIMKQLPTGSVNLIVTSPPYNLKNSTGNGMSVNTKSGKWAGAALQKGYSHYDDCMPHEEYAKWQNDCLKEMYRLLSEDGAIFYNHKRRVQNGRGCF